MKHALGIVYVGLSVYNALGVFPSVLVSGLLKLVMSFVAGIVVAMLICGFARKAVKVVLGAACVLLVGIDAIVIFNHALVRFTTTVPGFNSANGLLIGVSLTSAAFLWRETMERTRDQQAAG
jgi:hypothetical protein